MKIRGRTVGTTMPRPDWEQTNPAKADFIRNKPQLSKGDGEYSVTGGTNSSAFGDCSMAFGTNTIAGVKGFRMVSVDAENLLITVADAELAEKASAVYVVGDILQFDASKHYYDKLKIVSLSTNDSGQSVIGVENLTAGALDLSLDADPNENYIWAIDKVYGEAFPMAYGAHAEGELTKAMGRTAHAEGRETQAIGGYSHAEGRGTTANYCAHAEGSSAKASGEYSHAEGRNTISSGHTSHTEGFASEASGQTSHAEGWKTKAIGTSSHAEGYQTKAEGSYSHAEGNATTASGANSHTEGIYTIASGEYSHAEGASSVASGKSSHAEGQSAVASGENSHAEGRTTTASGTYSHAEGQTTKAIGNVSHAEGYGTKAEGEYSHAEGNGSVASGGRSHAEGHYTVASGSFSHAEGFYTEANAAYQHVQGKFNVEDTENKYAHIVGWGTSDTARKNIHTLDTAGNAWFAGSVFAANIPVEHPDYPGCYYRTVDGVTEWLNPPMEVGVEYRTAERWNGSPVYTKLIDFGAMPAATMKAVKHNLGSTQIVRYWAQVSDGTALPYNDGNVIVNASCNYTSLIIVSNIDQSTTNTAKFQVWYTK